jgi:hypothetical protein
MKEVGKDEDIQSFRQVGWKDYLVSEVKKVKGEITLPSWWPKAK